MKCQKCRTPLRVEASLDDLNPAAFHLLVGESPTLAGVRDKCLTKSLGSSAKSQQDTPSAFRHNYPSERKELYDLASRNATAPQHRRTVPAPQNDEATKDVGTRNMGASILPPDMSFVEVTESQVMPSEITRESETAPQSKLAKQIDGSDDHDGSEEFLHSKRIKNEKLFAILSAHSDIDHPICAECTSLLLQSFTARLANAARERDAYASFLKELQKSAASTNDQDEAKVEKELADLLQQDKEGYEELLKLEQEKAILEAEIADLEEESRQLDIKEEAFWASRNAFDDELHDLNTDLASLHQRYEHDQQQLEKLQRTNVYNDTFCIGHDGIFGTINGLRLGRLPDKKVEWAEINAAWGQTLLLLATVAERLDYKFKEYQLKPLGSTSKIIKLEWPQQAPVQSHSANPSQAVKPSAEPKTTVLPLYSSGETPLGRLGQAGKFDNALVAFLDCLAQVGDYVEQASGAAGDGRPRIGRTLSSKTVQSTRVLPYKIHGDKIGDVSIKLGMGFQPDENFTKACKYALTCCKFLLAHVSNLENPKG
jgi:beclin